ncbi:MAG: cytochrome C [Bacteroides sp. SM23_62]|nr:MAG: cytochrome C [Bacteroides sp. SM23_62]
MKLPSSVYNWTSVIGAVIAIISLFMIVFLIVVSFFIEVTSSYLGIVIYIILPIFLILGLILIPIGMVRKRRRMRRQEEAGLPRWPRVDLNLKQHRNAFSVFVISSTAFLFLSAVGTYEAFHFTESVEFCGNICHNVMHPEYITYQNSAHARVPCVDCHVGSGADWYVRSKLSGLYQVYSVLFKKYPKPIPTPITDLRPAQETCERCHWPEQFYAPKLRTEKHYLADENNTEWDIILKMKIGSEYHALGLEEGIHWHINPNVKIEYAADPDDREIIPWVRYTNLETGEVHTYMDEENMPDSAMIAGEKFRHMDCIDCHNRPSHEYYSPPFFTDNSLTRGDIPRELPDIKQVAMGLLYAGYEGTDSALATIEKDIREYYELMYPEIYQDQFPLIQQAITGIQEDFTQNMFPEMKAQWDVYPNHIGHINSEGCYRCHNDRHKSASGRVISKDCNLCHDILAQGNPDRLNMAGVRDSLEFIHPIDIGEAWKEFHCVDCHRYLY